jgi:hypothetical protein
MYTRGDTLFWWLVPQSYTLYVIRGGTLSGKAGRMTSRVIHYSCIQWGYTFLTACSSELYVIRYTMALELYVIHVYKEGHIFFDGLFLRVIRYIFGWFFGQNLPPKLTFSLNQGAFFLLAPRTYVILKMGLLGVLLGEC